MSMVLQHGLNTSEILTVVDSRSAHTNFHCPQWHQFFPIFFKVGNFAIRGLCGEVQNKFNEKVSSESTVEVRVLRQGGKVWGAARL